MFIGVHTSVSFKPLVGLNLSNVDVVDIVSTWVFDLIIGCDKWMAYVIA